MNISMLSEGDSARILNIDGGSHLYRQRLFAAGVRPGARCHVIQSAPLGDPIKVSVNGHMIALRRAEAQVILVDPASIEVCYDA
ncbi:MAG: ferrous iron transport protein A [Legionellales bacterium]|mgnify:CR=1 FL=1|nr:ferrous iron transport protein A [Legionellales bacterium]|tara:strand:- start:561 stop:812 length:252 start_codon:yes stop_codon:yes gene_type:complete